MGVLTWLPLLAAVTVICGEPAIAIDPVTVHVASEFGDHPATKQVTLRTSQHAAAHNLPALAPGKQCFDKKQLEYSKTTGIVHIATANVSTCAKATGLHALVLIYDDDTKKFMLADGKTTFAVDDDAALDKHLDKLVTAILRNQPTKMDGSDVAVPVWLIITVGTLFGVLMAGNCIFFNMARKARMRDEIAETKKKSSSKSSSSHKASGSSKRGGSNSGQKKKKASGSSRSSRSSRSAKSSSGKKKKSRSSSSSKGVQKASVSSCRSSKSLSTRTCDAGAPTSVKVVAVAAPPLHKMLPSEKDEVATVMASRAGLPERTLERVRAGPAAAVTTVSPPTIAPTVPKCYVPSPPPSQQPPPQPPSSGSGSGPTTVPHRAPVICSQPRPKTMGPPIVPTVSVMGHAPTPFEVLAKGTSPLPPASTPAIFKSLQTAYSTPSISTVVTQAPPLPTTSTVPPVIPTSPSTPPLVTVSPPTSVAPKVPPTTSSFLSKEVAPSPLTLVPPVVVSSPSAIVPVSVSPVVAPVSTVVPPPPPPPPTVSPPVAPPVTVAPPTAPTTPPPVDTRPPISPAYSLASTPTSSASPSSSRERAPVSKRSQRK